MKESIKSIYLNLEYERACKYLRQGVKSIEEISMPNDFYDPLLLFLSSGFERLYKVLLTSNFKKQNDRYPNNGEVWNRRNGHKIVGFKDRVHQLFISNEYMMKPEILGDSLDMELVDSVCQILENFATQARYFDLDMVQGTIQPFDAKASWEELETKIGMAIYGKENFFEMLQSHKSMDSIYQDINYFIVQKLKAYLNLIELQMIHGDMLYEGHSYLPLCYKIIPEND